MSSFDDGDDKKSLEQVISEKRRKRLEKNRESARECRRRKKEHLLEVQSGLARLEAENLELKLQLKIGDEAEEIENAQVESIKDQLDGMVSQGVDEAEIQRIIKELKEQHADYGRNRTSAATYHLDQLARLVLPTTTTRACMYAILQDYEEREARKAAVAAAAAVATAPANGAKSASDCDPSSVGGPSGAAGASLTGMSAGGVLPALASKAAGVANGVEEAAAAAARAQRPRLWDLMATELGVTPEAQEVLRGKAHIIKDLEEELQQLMALIVRLKGLVNNRSRNLDDEMSQIQSILTPTQTAKFVLWVAQNQACMHMLERLWEKREEDAFPWKREQ